MHRGSSKHRRGSGGGRAGKRRISSASHPPAKPGGRLSLGSGAAGPRNRSTASGPTPSASSNAAEETFSLVSGNRLHFAMIIRLAPDLVEEIKRAEAHGGTTRIKFDANANNSAGNVINVGSKDFRFTWSRDRGDLCDIYEECQNDEDGNGLLVESGSAWRKVNVQRVLDESTKNHVKMLSEEAERKSKSRKTIVLDPHNPSTKSQVKETAAVEGNGCKMAFKQPPRKKRKDEPPPARGPLKPAYKSGFSTTSPLKGRPSTSTSPVSSPFGGGLLKDLTKDVAPTQPINKTTNSVKETANKVISSGAQGISECGKSTSSKPSDLWCMLITVLMDNQSNGMTLKALEKAVGNAFPNSARQIEPILKKVATFKAPGRYFLKPGLEIESFKKSTIGSGSSPEDNGHTSPTHNKHELQVPVSSLPMRIDTNALERQTRLNSKPKEAPTFLEKVDIVQLSPDYFAEQKASDHIEEAAGSCRYRGSDSDSESDSSGGGLKSRSRSPVDSGSASDSISDNSSNSEEASDDDEDIMIRDDDRWVNYKLHATENGFSRSHIPLTSQDTEPGQFRIGEKDYTCVTDVLEIEKDLRDAEMTNVTESGPIEESRFQMRKLCSETVKMTNNQSDGFGRAPKSNCERVPDRKQDDKPNGAKRQQVSTSAAQNDTKQGFWPLATKECQMQKINLVAGLNDGWKDTSLIRSNDGCEKTREPSPDEICCSYSKYEKKEPELRVPINGFSQYKEYIEEYHEKYEKYCSLKKTLESYRFEFFELGKDLHICKGKDMDRYYEILELLKDSYCQNGPRHKRLKKIFIVLHEELKHLKQTIGDFVASYCKDG